LVAVSKSLNALSILFPSRIYPGSGFVVDARALYERKLGAYLSARRLFVA
jgi:hypothetical protein